MREGLFIRKNRKRWEEVQQGVHQSADETARDFVQLVDDLAYARTFYPSSRVTQFINSLASRIYLNIYRNRKEESNRLITFWKYDVPLTIYRYRRIMLMALVIFTVFFSVGFFSASREPSFVREVLGDHYVNITEKNIAAGKPFDIYASENSFVMWIRIMLNNIFVSFIYFFRGLLLGIPSLTALGKESIRLGAFEHMFYTHGLGGQAVVTVLIHGLLELTAIIIACAAGVVMGISWLFPGTGRRIDAFRRGTKDGIKMVIGLVPVFMIAAFFEGYLTRHYQLPIAFSLFILLVSATFVIWYFIIYPVKLSRSQQGIKTANE